MTGFYSLKSSEIHSPFYLFVQYPNDKRYYLHSYEHKDFLKFVNKHLDKLYDSQDQCAILNELTLFWCEKVIPFR